MENLYSFFEKSWNIKICQYSIVFWLNKWKYLNYFIFVQGVFSFFRNIWLIVKNYVAESIENPRAFCVLGKFWFPDISIQNSLKSCRKVMEGSWKVMEFNFKKVYEPYTPSIVEQSITECCVFFLFIFRIHTCVPDVYTHRYIKRNSMSWIRILTLSIFNCGI